MEVSIFNVSNNFKALCCHFSTNTAHIPHISKVKLPLSSHCNFRVAGKANQEWGWSKHFRPKLLEHSTHHPKTHKTSLPWASPPPSKILRPNGNGVPASNSAAVRFWCHICVNLCIYYYPTFYGHFTFYGCSGFTACPPKCLNNACSDTWGGLIACPDHGRGPRPNTLFFVEWKNTRVKSGTRVPKPRKENLPSFKNIIGDSGTLLKLAFYFRQSVK